MKCFPLVDIYFLTMTAADPELEQRRVGPGGGRFACPTGFSSSVNPFFSPKLKGGLSAFNT